MALRELSVDARLRSRALRDHLRLRRVRAPKLGLPLHDVALEGPDLPHRLRVLARDAVHRVDAVQKVVEVPRAEQHLERRVLRVRGVDGDEPRRQGRLGVAEVRLRDLKLEARALLVALDAGELDVRRVVGLDRALEADVEAVDLRQHLAGLALFRGDRGVGGSRPCGGEECRKGDDERWRQPSV